MAPRWLQALMKAFSSPWRLRAITTGWRPIWVV
jgi:hypothetical protein